MKFNESADMASIIENGYGSCFELGLINNEGGKKRVSRGFLYCTFVTVPHAGRAVETCVEGLRQSLRISLLGKVRAMDELAVIRIVAVKIVPKYPSYNEPSFEGSWGQ